MHDGGFPVCAQACPELVRGRVVALQHDDPTAVVEEATHAGRPDTLPASCDE
jgi:hypothetical protein